MHASLQKTKAGMANDLDHFAMTYWSTDYGKTWERITAPSLDSKEELYSCRDHSCYLNIHLLDTRPSYPLQATDAAPGTLMAIGNVGPYLSQTEIELAQFISQDGGHTWKEIDQGRSFISEITDQGGILISAVHKEKTKKIKFSTDGGRNWQIAALDIEGDVILNGAFIEPTNNAHWLVLAARHPNQNKGFLISLDFEHLYDRECKGMFTPDTQESDYETFIPEGLTDKKCRQLI